MSSIRWHKENEKYYQASLDKDMLGDWVVFCEWGSLYSRLGNSKSHAFSEREEALRFIRSLSKRRAKRGYIQIIAN